MCLFKDCILILRNESFDMFLFKYLIKKYVLALEYISLLYFIFQRIGLSKMYFVFEVALV